MTVHLLLLQSWVGFWVLQLWLGRQVVVLRWDRRAQVMGPNLVVVRLRPLTSPVLRRRNRRILPDAFWRGRSWAWSCPSSAVTLVQAVVLGLVPGSWVVIPLEPGLVTAMLFVPSFWCRAKTAALVLSGALPGLHGPGLVLKLASDGV